MKHVEMLPKCLKNKLRPYRGKGLARIITQASDTTLTTLSFIHFLSYMYWPLDGALSLPIWFLPAGAAEGDGCPQVRGLINQSQKCRLPPNRAWIWGGMGAAGGSERDERILGSSRCFSGGLEGRIARGADAMSGTKTHIRTLFSIIPASAHRHMSYFSTSARRSSMRWAMVSCCGWRT